MMFIAQEESPAYGDGSARASSLGSPVIIVQVRSHSPDSGSFQFSRDPQQGERAAVFHSDRERQLWSCRFAKACRNDGALTLPPERLVARRRNKLITLLILAQTKSRANSRGFADPFQRFKKS
jgi:hypothetical protein